MTTILNGVLGGLLVGILAVLVTRLLETEPSATREALKRTLGGLGETSKWVRFTVQVLYGGLAGGLLVALELYVLDVLAIPPTVGEAFGVAVAWSSLLLGILLVIWRVDSSLTLDRWRISELVVFHLVFGLGLGLWIRLTWMT